MSATPPKRPLPPGWRWARLGDICRPDRNPISPGSDEARQRPYIGLENIESETGRISLSGAGKAPDVRSVTFAFDQRHVLYGKLRPYLNKTALSDFSGRCATEIVPLLPSPDCDRHYLSWLLRRPATVEWAMRFRTGTKMPRADLDDLFALQVPLPPLDEQRRIAARLSEQMAQVERMRQAAKAQVEAARALPGAFLRQVFESEEAKGWPRKTLGEVCQHNIEIRDPARGSEGTFVYVDISSVDNLNKRIVSPQVLGSKQAPNRARQVITANDVLVSTTRPNLNAVSLVPPELDGQICSTGFCILRASHQMSPLFLFYFVQSPRFVEIVSSLVRGALYPAVTDTQVFELPTPCPSPEEQERIATSLSQRMAHTEKLRQAAQAQLEAVNALPGAFLEEVFGGFEPPPWGRGP